MMKQRKEDIEKEVGRTMMLLEKMESLEVHHLFRARLMQRIEREYGGELNTVKSRISRSLDFRLAFVILLIIINFGSAMISLRQNDSRASAGISEMIDNLSDDYSSTEFAYYDQTASSPAETMENQAP